MKRRLSPSTQPDPSKGSPSTGELLYLAVGRLRRTHGIEGAMLMEILTDFPDRLRSGKLVFVGEEHQLMRMVSVRRTDRDLIVRLEGLHTPEEANMLRGSTVYIKAQGLPVLPEGQYYHHQLLGLKVVDEAGQEIGKLDHIIETGANDVYVVQTLENKELLLPATDEVILKIDLEQQVMTVHLLEYY